MSFLKYYILWKARFGKETLLMNHVVIFAGGIGSRMGNTGCPKQFLKLDDKEIIVHTIERFQHHPSIDGIYIACHVDWMDYMKELVEKYALTKVKSIVPGGQTGQLSIYNGLLEAEKYKETDDDIVLIHDGVRPNIDEALISENIKCVREKGSSISCSPAIETVLLVDEERNIKQIEDRSMCFYAKAPQSFLLKDIISCHRHALDEGRTNFIDSCTMMKYYGFELHLVPCSSDNIKITTPKDFYLLKALQHIENNDLVD